MARSAPEERRAVASLAEIAQNDLVHLWPQLQGLSPEKVKAALAEILPDLGDKYGDAAASMAADWYEDLREDAGVRSRFQSVLAKRRDEAQWRSLIWRVMAPFYTVDPSPDPDGDALVLARGGLQKAVADQHRLTIVDSSKADTASKGWRRIGIGENCKFCEMLISRGEVYHGDTVTFRAHDHCNCAAQPTWSSDVYVTGEPYEQSKHQPRSKRARRERNRRAYDWMDEHLGGH